MQTKTDLKAVILLIVLPFLWYAALVFTNARYFVGDVMDQYFPWWTLAHNSFHAGEFPMWSPYALGGTPYHASPQNALFYPLNLPLFFMPFCDAMIVLRVLHSIVASLGMYFLLRRWKLLAFPSFIGAVMFSYGSFMAYEILYLTYINTMVWFPLQLLCICNLIRKPSYSNSIWLAIVTATSFLGGMPQVFFFCHLVLGIFFMFILADSIRSGQAAGLWMTLRYLAFAVLMTIGLTVVLLVPTACFMALSPAAQPELIHKFFYQYSFIEAAYQVLFFPFCHVLYGAPYPPVQHIYNVEVPYMGIAAMFLVLFHFKSRRYSFLRPSFLIVGIFSVLMSKGVNTGFFPWVFHHFKPFQWFRWPYDYLHMLYPTLAITAASGLDIFWRNPSKNLRWASGALALYLAAAAVWIPCVFTVVLLLISVAVAALLFSRLRLPAWAVSNRMRTAFACIFGLMLMIDLTWYGSGFQRFMPRDLYELEQFKPVSDFIENSTDYQRVSVATFDLMYINEKQTLFFEPFLVHENRYAVSKWKTAKDWLRDLERKELKDEMWIRENRFKYSNFNESQWDVGLGFPSHAGLVFGYQDIGGYDRFMLERVRRMYTEIPMERIWDLFNVQYIVTPNRIINDKLDPVLSTDWANVYSNNAVLPRVMTPHIVRHSMDSEFIIKRVKDVDFDPREELLLEADIVSPLAEQGLRKGNKARIIEYSANRVLIEAEMQTPGPLVLHDVYYPGWEASVGGEKLEIFRANYAFRACLLPAGKQIVEFRYVPRLFYLSAVVSALCWLFCLVFLARHGRVFGGHLLSLRERGRNLS